MVTQAEGNVVLSIAVSTLANILGCFSTPLLFSYLAQVALIEVGDHHEFKLFQEVKCVIWCVLVCFGVLTGLFLGSGDVPGQDEPRYQDWQRYTGPTTSRYFFINY